jgi:hypothetical protein
MPRAKFTAAVYLLLVFLSGAMVGAFAHRLYMVKTVLSTSVVDPAPRRPGPADLAQWRKHTIEELHTKVKLDDQQIVTLQQIFDQTHAEFDDLHLRRKPEEEKRQEKRNAEDQVIQNHMIAKINAILRDDQKPLYQQYRAEREAEREKEKKRRQANGDNRKGN